METQLVNLYQILKGCLQELQEFKIALGHKESWKNKKYERMSDEAVAWLNNELCVPDNQNGSIDAWE